MFNFEFASQYYITDDRNIAKPFDIDFRQLLKKDVNCEIIKTINSIPPPRPQDGQFCPLTAGMGYALNALRNKTI